MPRSLAVFGLIAALFSSTAWAKKKEAAPAAPAVPAGPIAPEPDAMGHVHFGPQSGEGLGRVTVRAAPSDRVQVWLEGRYFGDAPITIYSVPKGDYILEGKYPDGREVSKPLSIGENEESVVDLSGGKPMAGGSSGSKLFGGEIAPKRLMLTKVFLGAAAASLVVGVVFGILELNAQSDYEKTPSGNQAQLDSITTRGQRDALIANIGYFGAGAFLIGAAIAGYPMVIKQNPEKTQTTAFTFSPVIGHGTTGGSLVLRF